MDFAHLTQKLPSETRNWSKDRSRDRNDRERKK